MTTSQKAALSLLIAVLLFGAFTALAFTGLFDLIEARFYNPSITASISRDNIRNAGVVNNFFEEIQNHFSRSLNNPAVRRSFLPNQSAEDIFERSRIYGFLTELYKDIQWVRFIDSRGSRLHYSTFGPDIQRQDSQSIAYRDYSEVNLPYEVIAVGDNEKPKYTFDERADRIIFSYPFYDSFDVYRGTAVLAFSVKAVEDRLISEGRIKFGQEISVISEPAGLLFGTPAAGESALPSQIAFIWKDEGWQKTTRLISPNSGISLALISYRTSEDYIIGRLVNESLFAFPQTMKIIMLVSFFLTVYLTIFLLFNLRQDSVTIVQNRLKRLQISLIEQFYEQKSDVDWARWSRELEQRRDEINLQLKKGIKSATGSKSKDIDTLIDKSWDELISVMGGRRDEGLDEKKLETILSRILAALPGAGAPVQITPQAQNPSVEVPAPAAGAVTEEAEPLEELEEVEAVEELEEIEEAEAVEVLEEAEAVEELQEIETAEPVEVLEEAGTAEEPPEIEIAEPVEVLEEAEAAEELQEIEIVEPVEVLEEAGATEELPEIEIAEPVEELEEVEAMGELEEVEPFEVLEELEELEDTTAFEDNSESGKPQAATIEEMASQIEFSSTPETDLQEDVTVHEDLEIVSPFSTMLSDFSGSDGIENIHDEGETVPEFPEDTPDNTPEEIPEEILGEIETVEALDSEEPELLLSPEPATEAQPDQDSAPEEDEKKNIIPSQFLNEDSKDQRPDENDSEPQDASLVEDTNKGLSLVYKPFGADENIETLETLGEENESGSIDEGVIEEREGVPYISGDVLDTDDGTSEKIDKNFKNLIDSIIK